MPIHDVIRAAISERRKKGVPYLKEDEADLLAIVPDKATPSGALLRSFMKDIETIMVAFEQGRFGKPR